MSFISFFFKISIYFFDTEREQSEQARKWAKTQRGSREPDAGPDPRTLGITTYAEGRCPVD